MFIVIWEYRVKPEKQAEFEQFYSAEGNWAELFKRGAGFTGTELWQDEGEPLRYLTIDRWKSQAQYEAFQTQWAEAYQALDAQCEALTEQEARLGGWQPVVQT